MKRGEREKIQFEVIDYLGIIKEGFNETLLDNLEDNPDYLEYIDENGSIVSQLWLDYEIIEETLADYELDKQYEQFRVIVKRLSDDVYFEGYYYEATYNANILEVNDYHDCVLSEVFPEEKTIIVYE